jgi:SRSO17 transposase
MPSLLSSSAQSPEAIWSGAFEQLGKRIGPVFARAETRERAQAYLRGLLSPIERKNGWQLAEEAGEATPYAMQYLLDRARWDADQLRDILRDYVCEQLADGSAELVIDETGFLKKGPKSVGVQRQYSGTAGRSENCQLGVFLSYARPKGHTLLDRELYLPKSWTENPARCQQADVPADVTFATKPALAARMLWRTLAAGVPAAWVIGDTVYGTHRPLRAGLEARLQAYALAGSSQEHVEVAGAQKRVDQLAKEVAPEAWQRLSAGEGSKGPRLYDWVQLPLSSPVPQGWQPWLVIRRSMPTATAPAELAYVFVFARQQTSLQQLVLVSGARWTVEQCLPGGKGEVGLDQYEVRSWQGWYRHISLCMLAQAFLTVLRTQRAAQDPEPAQAQEKKLRTRPQAQPTTRSLSPFKRKRGLSCP